ncbi:hypothetical protein SAMN05192529_10916 [Arachidicoccus rhizosphaerae]|uniref:Uncharacterized protein n=1 Tax=Arachidicoccus rhizosphaerae TaxID=551991 RepID=A0A1H3YRV1_9BACT|nr:hypothetical protein SAMN05192529_10916 [Arachidicoccus rhizosphaerae]
MKNAQIITQQEYIFINFTVNGNSIKNNRKQTERKNN